MMILFEIWNRIVFGALHLLLGVAAFVTSARQKKAGKDFRVLQVFRLPIASKLRGKGMVELAR